MVQKPFASWFVKAKLDQKNKLLQPKEQIMNLGSPLGEMQLTESTQNPGVSEPDSSSLKDMNGVDWKAFFRSCSPVPPREESRVANLNSDHSQAKKPKSLSWELHRFFSTEMQINTITTTNAPTIVNIKKNKSNALDKTPPLSISTEYLNQSVKKGILESAYLNPLSEYKKQLNPVKIINPDHCFSETEKELIQCSPSNQNDINFKKNPTYNDQQVYFWDKEPYWTTDRDQEAWTRHPSFLDEKDWSTTYNNSTDSNWTGQNSKSAQLLIQTVKARYPKYTDKDAIKYIDENKQYFETQSLKIPNSNDTVTFKMLKLGSNPLSSSQNNNQIYAVLELHDSENPSGKAKAEYPISTKSCHSSDLSCYYLPESDHIAITHEHKSSHVFDDLNYDIHLLNKEVSNPPKILQGHIESPPTRLCEIYNGRFIASLSKDKVLIWDPNLSYARPLVLMTLPEQVISGSFHNICQLPNGLIITINSSLNNIKAYIWDLSDQLIHYQHGTVTTNSGNTVESQKWPLGDSIDTALTPQKPAKKESSTISENSTYQHHIASESTIHDAYGSREPSTHQQKVISASPVGCMHTDWVHMKTTPNRLAVIPEYISVHYLPSDEKVFLRYSREPYSITGYDLYKPPLSDTPIEG